MSDTAADICPNVTASLPPNLKLRFLDPQHDYSKRFLETLSQLSMVGSLSKQDFDDTWNQITAQKTFILVLEDTEKGKIVASGSLLLEQKFLHQGGLAGHIEDVVCDEGYRGHSLGKKLIAALVYLAKQKGCYKVILDCNVGSFDIPKSPNL